MTSPIPRIGFSRPFTRGDLVRMPDDGRRYELVDGVLIVSPVPGRLHQRALARLAMLLDSACPPDLEVLIGPFAVGLADETELRPDILVARRDLLTEDDLPGPPLLAVEVLSSSTRLIDLNVKRKRYERSGTPSFWAVDPVTRPDEAQLVAWELAGDGLHRQVADVTGEEEFTAELPYAVSVIPAALVR
jgi:Uma2 family endonuclease